MFGFFGKTRGQAGGDTMPPVGSNDKKRDRQKNVKASAKCLAIFAECAKAQGISEAALFEDMVAERRDVLQKSGVVFRDAV